MVLGQGPGGFPFEESSMVALSPAGRGSGTGSHRSWPCLAVHIRVEAARGGSVISRQAVAAEVRLV